MHLKLMSLLGMVLLLALAWAWSSHRRLFPWRTVLWGLALQFGFALLILKTPWGQAVFDFTAKAVNTLIGFANEGCKFVFGPLADAEALKGSFGPGNGFVFAITVTGTIIIVSSLSSLLYHWGVLQRVVHAIAWVMQKVMRTSGSETLSAAANIFMGQTEAPLLVKPYLARMTTSELLCLMIGGMATLAGGVAAVYVKIASDAGHPEFAGHLLTASVLGAPAALMMSKILLPETGQSETAATAPATTERVTVNGIDALCRGAGDGLTLSLNVLAMLIAFIAVVALVNFLLGFGQSQVVQVLAGLFPGRVHPDTFQPVTLQTLFGWLNAPFAWVMGVPWEDCLAIGQVLGERIVMNEFIGYVSLNKLTVDPRSYALATYALCGFANVASIAIQVGGIGSLAPGRRPDLARLGVRAMVGGLLARYVTATVAGVLI